MAPNVAPFVPMIKVDGSALEGAWVTDIELLEVDNAVSTTSRLELLIRDDELFTLSNDPNGPKFGSTITVDLPMYDAQRGLKPPHTVFDGLVTAIGVERPDQGHLLFRIEALDRSFTLSHGDAAGAITENRTAEDVLKAIATDSGFTAVFTGLPNFKYSDHFRCTTRRELLDVLTRQFGLVWWMESKALHIDKMGAGRPGPTLVVGADIRSFDLGVDARRSSGVRAVGWNGVNNTFIEQTANPPSASGPPLVTKAASAAAKLNGKPKEVRGGVDDATADAVKAAANGAMLGEHERSVRLRVVTETWDQSRPPAKFTVDGGGPANGSYVATRIVHRIRAGEGLLTIVDAGPWESASLTELLRPVPAAFEPQQFLVGEVTKVNRDPLQAHRVKIRYPTVSQKLEANWARVLVPGGGGERGFAFYPAVGDFVLVGFEGGDVNLPVVLGGLVGKGKHTGPPIDGASKKITRTAIQTATGSNLIIDDDPGKESVTLELKGNGIKDRIVVMDKDGVLVTSDKRIEFKVGQSTLRLEPDGKITLEGTEILLKGQKTVTVDATQDAIIKGKSSVKADGGGGTSKLELAGGKAELNSAGVTNVKGSMVNIN